MVERLAKTELSFIDVEKHLLFLSCDATCLATNFITLYAL